MFPKYKFENTSSKMEPIGSEVSKNIKFTDSDMKINIDSTRPVLNIRIEFFYNELTIPEVFELEVL